MFKENTNINGLAIDSLREALDARGMATLNFSGRSMLPTLKSRQKILIRKMESSQLREGDIILFISDSNLVAHRLIKIKNRADAPIFIIKGDNQIFLEEINKENILGIAIDSLYDRVLPNKFLAKFYIFSGKLTLFLQEKKYLFPKTIRKLFGIIFLLLFRLIKDIIKVLFRKVYQVD